MVMADTQIKINHYQGHFGYHRQRYNKRMFWKHIKIKRTKQIEPYTCHIFNFRLNNVLIEITTCLSAVGRQKMVPSGPLGLRNWGGYLLSISSIARDCGPFRFACTSRAIMMIEPSTLLFQLRGDTHGEYIHHSEWKPLWLRQVNKNDGVPLLFP